jgi:hypothetical protein
MKFIFAVAPVDRIHFTENVQLIGDDVLLDIHMFLVSLTKRDYYYLKSELANSVTFPHAHLSILQHVI